MKTCNLCGKLKSGAETCTDYQIEINGVLFMPVKYETGAPNPFRPEDALRRCPDCNVMPGSYHHVECGMEICPSCGGKWIFCRCQGIKIKNPDFENTCNVIDIKKRKLFII